MIFTSNILSGYCCDKFELVWNFILTCQNPYLEVETVNELIRNSVGILFVP